MGNSNCKIYERKDLEIDQNHKKDDKIYLHDSCVSAISTDLQYLCPNNGEYGNGISSKKCTYCSFDQPKRTNCKLCKNINCCPIIGYVPYCVREKYLADEEKCCFNSTNNYVIDGKTCDPKNRGPESKYCKKFLIKKCDNENIFSKKCKNLCLYNKTLCNKIKSRVCNEHNFKSKDVTNKCLEYAMLNQGECDLFIRKYCEIYPNDKICSCLQINSNEYLNKINPKCMNQKCIKEGYGTQLMIKGAKNCNIHECIINYDITADGVYNKDVENIQYCDDEIKNTSIDKIMNIHKDLGEKVYHDVRVKKNNLKIKVIKDLDIMSFNNIIIGIICIMLYIHIIIFMIYK